MDEDLTLREGLRRFHEEYEDHLSHDEAGVSQEARQFFTSHDVAHVVFGCDISLYGEGAVKIWTILGTTLGFWKHIGAYRHANALALSQNFTLAHAATNVVRFLASILVLAMRARRMHKRWPWRDFEPYLDTPISEIRREFNIEVLR